MADLQKPDDDKTITDNKTPATETKSTDTPTTETTAPGSEQLDLNSDNPSPDKTAEDAAALAQAEKATDFCMLMLCKGDCRAKGRQHVAHKVKMAVDDALHICYDELR